MQLYIVTVWIKLTLLSVEKSFPLVLEYMLIKEFELYFETDFFFLDWLSVVPQLGRMAVNNWIAYWDVEALSDLY